VSGVRWGKGFTCHAIRPLRPKAPGCSFPRRVSPIVVPRMPCHIPVPMLPPPVPANRVVILRHLCCWSNSFSISPKILCRILRMLLMEDNFPTSREILAGPPCMLDAFSRVRPRFPFISLGKRSNKSVFPIEFDFDFFSPSFCTVPAAVSKPIIRQF